MSIAKGKDKVAIAGILLFGHGARTSNYIEPFERIKMAVLKRNHGVPIAIGFLELSQPSFEDAAHALIAEGVSHIQVVPIFFAPGRHVLHDLPKRIAALLDVLMLQKKPIQIELAPPVGESTDVIAAMANQALLELEKLKKAASFALTIDPTSK